MTVVVNHAYLLDDTGKTEDLNAFTIGHKTLVIPIVDAAIKYKCHYEGNEFALAIRNAIHVPI